MSLATGTQVGVAPGQFLAPKQIEKQQPYRDTTKMSAQSATNPQAGPMDFGSVDKYIDQSYNNAMTRLQPQMDQGRDAMSQALVDRGFGVGSEGYNEAMQQQGQVENDALQNAAFQAMGFGTNLQNQMFNQANARSQLANSLMQAQMQTGLGYAGLNEQGRQFNNTFGEQARQFDNQFLEGMRQYNDQSGQQWDDRAFRDLSWLDNQSFRNRQYNDQQDMNWFNMRQALLGAIPGWNPAQIDVTGSAGAATNSQQANFDAGMQQNQQMWNNLGTAAGAAMMFSDPRLKDNVTKLGEVNGLNWYSWDWNAEAEAIGLSGSSSGVMADEVPESMLGPEIEGYMTVNYSEVLA